MPVTSTPSEAFTGAVTAGPPAGARKTMWEVREASASMSAKSRQTSSVDFPERVRKSGLTRYRRRVPPSGVGRTMPRSSSRRSRTARPARASLTEEASTASRVAKTC